MSDEGYIPRDAYHAERRYWQRNPPRRPTGYITAKEAAMALGVSFRTFQYKLARGEFMGRTMRIGTDGRKRTGQWWFNKNDIADLALGKLLK